MKRTALALIAACFMTLPAMAQTAVTVRVPTDTSNPAAVEAFRKEVALAVRSVCVEEEGPVLAFNLYGIRKCIAETSRDVARLDSTGVLSAELVRDRALQLAAK
jgi:UrcA family protein